MFNPDSAQFIGMGSDDAQVNQLLKYLQHQPPEVLTRVAQSVSGELKQIIRQDFEYVGAFKSYALLVAFFMM